jgi:hypothetical protein
MYRRKSNIKSARTLRLAASSATNPRSSNTFSLPRRTWMLCCGLLEPVRALRRFVALLAKGDIVLAGLLRFLLEGMEHIDGLLKLSEIEHAVRIIGLETQLIGPWPYDRHRLKVARFVTALDGA